MHGMHAGKARCIGGLYKSYLRAVHFKNCIYVQVTFCTSDECVHDAIFFFTRENGLEFTWFNVV